MEAQALSSTQKHNQEFLDFGTSLISQTRALILNLWQNSSISSTLKDDQTPVSEVDLECEELVRSLIRAKYPKHGIIGEELGVENEGAEYTWTIDPIDGTQNLINRIPTFGTILALLYRGQPIFGWIDHPILDITLSGGPTVGTFCNGKQVKIEDLAEYKLLANDVIATNCLATFTRGGHEEAYYQILRFHPHHRIYYDVYAHTLAVTGSVAFMVEYNLKIWDLAATKALVEGAGGVYHEVSSHIGSSGTALYNAIFGKPKAVELLRQELLKTK